MEDEAEIYDGVRAQFPLTFGKQSKAQTPLEAIHNTTRRTTTTTATKTTSPTSASATNGFPSLFSSSKAWLDSLRNSSRKTINPNPRIHSSEKDEDVVIGPTRPPTASGSADDRYDDEVVVGSPPPPQKPRKGDGDEEEEEDDVMIGPPRPPATSNLGESDSDEEDKEENRYRIPMSNEIVLKGHTKVRNSFLF